jgi:hypothetical protein
MLFHVAVPIMSRTANATMSADEATRIERIMADLLEQEVGTNGSHPDPADLRTWDAGPRPRLRAPGRAL